MYVMLTATLLQILFEETLYQNSSTGKPFVEILNSQGIIPGIKVDKGVMLLPDTDGETTTQVFPLLHPLFVEPASIS
jgi:fructose-bisphosphate aldolase class I